MSDTNTITCPCGFDSGKNLLKNHASIADQQTYLGMHWTGLSRGDGRQLWLCHQCIRKCKKLVQQVCNLIKNDGWTPVVFEVEYKAKGKPQ